MSTGLTIRRDAALDLVSLGAYKAGSDAKLDAALARIDDIETFLKQGKLERSEFADTCAQLAEVV